MHYQHFNPNLPGNGNMASADEILHLNESEQLDEAVPIQSSHAWMMYHHYNPELLKAMQCVIAGDQVEDVVDSLLEKLERGKIYSLAALKKMREKANKGRLIPVSPAARAAAALGKK